MAVGATMAQDGQRALGLLFARCAAEPACAAAFPDPQGDLTAILARLAAAPAEVSLADPFTGKPTSLRLSRAMAAATVQALSYAPETAALLPLLIRRAAEGDLAPLAAQSLIVESDLADSISQGLRLAVLCAEDVPRYPPDLAALAAGSYLGDEAAHQLAAACAGWPSAPAEALPTPSPMQVPALLLSGEADPVTPPAYAEDAARLLPNSRQVVAPGQGHNVFFRGCLPGLVADFLAAGGAAKLDTSCAERLRAQPFFTSFTGP
jgi:pimeloyl-ACP methyl ester carboxylesterase